MVEAAAANGKHVFCEKPVGGTPAQTVAAERAARRAGVISGVGYNYRWAPLVQYAKQLVDSGAIGDDHELLRPVLLDVRLRSARPAVVAVPRRPGGPRRVDRHPQPLRRPRPLPDRWRRRADHPRRRAPARSSSSSGRVPTGAGTHYDRGQPGRSDRSRSPTRTTSARCASSRAVPAARSRRAGRWSVRRARTCSRSTARRVRSAGTSSR